MFLKVKRTFTTSSAESMRLGVSFTAEKRKIASSAVASFSLSLCSNFWDQLKMTYNEGVP